MVQGSRTCQRCAERGVPALLQQQGPMGRSPQGCGEKPRMPRMPGSLQSGFPRSFSGKGDAGLRDPTGLRGPTGPKGLIPQEEFPGMEENNIRQQGPMGQNPQGCGEKLRMPKWNGMCGKIEQGRTNWFDQKKADAREVSKPYDNVVKAGLPPFCSGGVPRLAQQHCV